jgi:redox-sensitive bicupin YhaK (pirin superfamily)
VPRGVGEHPHRGFETVTLLYQGRVAHRDSAGNSGVIGPGDVQWMTAAGGVGARGDARARVRGQGGTLHGVQLWVNLPKKDKLSRAALPGHREGEDPRGRERQRARRA